MTKFQQILYVVLSALTASGLLWFGGFLFEKTANYNLAYIPKNYRTVAKLDLNNLIRKSAHSILIKNEDPELYNLLQKELTSIKTSDEPFKSSGINILSDVIFLNYNKKDFCLLFNLTDAEAFQSFCKEKNFTAEANDQVGVIHIQKKSKGNFFKQDFTTLDFKHKPNNIAEVFMRSELIKGTVHLNLYENSMQIDGIVQDQTTLNEKPIKSLSSQGGVSIMTKLIDGFLQDLISDGLSALDLKTPHVQSIALNYQGVEVVEHEDGYYIIPSLSLMVSTKEPFSIRSLFTSTKIKDVLGYTLSGDTLSFGNRKLYTKQLDERTSYLGRNQLPQFVDTDGTMLFSLSGNLGALLDIQGGGFMVSAAMEIIPGLSATKTMFSHVNLCKLEAKKSANGIAIQGKLGFKKGYSPMNEFLKLALSI